MWRWIKRLFKIAVILMVVLGLLVVVCNIWVTGSTSHHVFEDVEKVPYNEVGLVLGTSKHVAAGRDNLHFKHRMEAAAALFRAGKIDHVLVSGDNREKYYNEPRDMRDSLVELGVPMTEITLDYAGLRTLDSVVRAHEVFGLESFTIVSDGFHVGRAAFIAKQRNLDVSAFRAEPVGLIISSKTRVREYFARVKAVLDVHLLHTEPKYLKDGKEEPITVRRRQVPEDEAGGLPEPEAATVIEDQDGRF